MTSKLFRTEEADFKEQFGMMPNDRCSSCGSTETEILYESEAILSVCKDVV